MNIPETLKSIGIASINMEKVLLALIILAVCLIIVRLLTRAVNRTIEKLPIARSLHRFIVSLIRLLLYFLTIIIVASSLGIPVTSLIAVLSVAGLAVSLAAQNSLANVAGGLMILVSKPFLPGDYIEAAGVGGTVVDIGLAYTKIRTPDNKIIFAPNSSISGEKITNFTAEELRRVDINLGVSYDNSVEEVKAALQAAISAQALVLPEPEPSVTVLAYEEKCIRYVLRVWVRTADYAQVQAGLTEGLKQACETQGINMNYNGLTIRHTETRVKQDS